MRSSWDIDGETLQSIFAHETALPAGTVVPIDFSIDDGSVRLRLVHRRRERPRRSRRAARQDRLRRPHGHRARRHRDRARLSHAARRRRAGVRHRIRARGPAARRCRPGCYAVALAPWTLLARCCSAGAAGAATLAFVAAGLRRARERDAAALRSGRASCSTSRRSRSRSSRRSSRPPCARSTSRPGARSPTRVGLKRRDALLKSVVDSSTDAIVCIDAHGTIRTANPATARLFGCAARGAARRERSRISCPAC